MEPLPVVDEHVRAVAAPPQRTWDAVVAVMGGTPTVPGPLATAWGLEHRERRGDWARPTPGDAVPGFAVAEADPPRTLTLNGGHRFSRYEITFTLEPTDAGHTRLHARTAAAFPGPLRQISRPRPRWPRPPGAGCAAAPRRSPGCSW